MMMRKADFSFACDELRGAIGEAESTFVMQTNATLIDDEWIELLRHHRVNAGVSLDGPAGVHDRHRVDHRGRGTYSRVVRGLRMLLESARNGGDPFYMPSTITVIDPVSDARAIYRHLVDDLGLRHMDFLLPKSCYQNADRAIVDKYGGWLSALFDEWTCDEGAVSVRLCQDILDVVLQRRAHLSWGNVSLREWESLVCVASNGDLGPDDDLRSAARFWQDVGGDNVRTTSLADFLDSKAFHVLNRAKRTLPTACKPCVWANICGGGHLVNRYGPDGSFDNPSILCRSLQDFYSSVLGYLLRSGVSLNRLSSALNVPAH